MVNKTAVGEKLVATFERFVRDVGFLDHIGGKGVTPHPPEVPPCAKGDDR